MKTISIVSPCFNEESNIQEVYQRTCAVFESYPNYKFELIFIDNCSQDRTVELIKEICKKDKRVKLIVNSRNFGHIRSPFHALLQVEADAAALMASDLQTPPEMIKDFISWWEKGYESVVAVKQNSEESGLYYYLRKLYYKLVSTLSDIHLIPGFDGFGLFDRKVLDAIKSMKDPYPYFRGIVCEAGFSIKEIYFKQELRKRGVTSNNFYTLYDLAILGIINHSKVPLRISIFLGFFLSIASFCVAICYFIYKLIFWDSFTVGIAPMVIGLFLLISIQLTFMGIIGEYLAAIHDLSKRRPLVFEKERVNF